MLTRDDNRRNKNFYCVYTSRVLCHIIINRIIRSDGRLHDVAVVVGVLSTDAVLGVLVGREVILLVLEVVAQLRRCRLMPMQLLLVPRQRVHVVATDSGKSSVGVTRLLLLLDLMMMVVLLVVDRGIEAAVVATRRRVIRRAVQVINAQDLDLFLLQALLLLCTAPLIRNVLIVSISVYKRIRSR